MSINIKSFKAINKYKYNVNKYNNNVKIKINEL